METAPAHRPPPTPESLLEDANAHRLDGDDVGADIRLFLLRLHAEGSLSMPGQMIALEEVNRG